MAPLKFLAPLAGIISFVSSEVAYADNGQHFVSRRYYCSSAEKLDAGDQTISADGPSCEASRQAIAESVARSGGDVCRAFDQDWFWNRRSEEIQASGSCAPQ